MKKLLTVLAVLCMCSMSFARVMIQENITGLGVYLDFQHDWHKSDENNKNYVESGPIGGLSTSVLWEFKTDIKVPLHYYVGGDVGFFMYGFYLAPMAGMTYRVAQLKKTNLELNGSFSIGPLTDFWGGMHFYTQQSVDLIVCSRSRRWLYGGIGITNQMIPCVDFYPGFGVDWWNMDFIGLRLVAGIRI